MYSAVIGESISNEFATNVSQQDNKICRDCVEINDNTPEFC